MEEKKRFFVEVAKITREVFYALLFQTIIFLIE